ncbi:MAG: helix-turn-helix transcriptional regulator [Gammaproteobacteria bacterium]|nr:helix-turn-helix transcriptional regulator [Gammaproteobacteria bacterium]
METNAAFNGRKEGLSSRIKAARVKSGISQAELARRMDISRASVSIWESGGNVSQDNIVKLASLLKVTPEWLQYDVSARPEVDVEMLKNCLIKTELMSKKLDADLNQDQQARLAAYLYTEELRGTEPDENRISDLIRIMA